jgi:hypothetical protein
MGVLSKAADALPEQRSGRAWNRHHHGAIDSPREIGEKVGAALVAHFRHPLSYGFLGLGGAIGLPGYPRLIFKTIAATMPGFIGDEHPKVALC